MSAMETVRHNWRICLRFELMRFVFFGTSVMTTYYISVVGLTTTEVFWLQTTLSIIVVVGDMPFGYLTDRIGQRKMMIAGSLAWFAQSLAFPFCRTFPTLVLALAGTGLYIAMLSNTAVSTITLSLKALDSKKVEQRLLQRYLAQRVRWTNVGYVTSILMGGGFVWAGGLRLPYFVQPITGLICLAFAWRIVNPNVTALGDHGDRGMLVRALKMMLITRRDIRYVLILSTCCFVFSMLIYWVLQPKMEQVGIPTSMFSIVYVLWASVSIVFADSVKYDELTKTRPLWLVLIVLPPLGALWAGVSTGLASFVVLMCGMTAISLFSQRLVQEYLNMALPDSGQMRNTELAIASTVPALVFAAVSPLFGRLAESSMDRAFVTLAITYVVLMSVGFVLFWRTAKK